MQHQEQTGTKVERHQPILPADLELGLARLDRGELNRLAKAVMSEFRRRGLSLQTETDDTARSTSAAQHVRASEPPTERPRLSQARMNAVRAAVRAGVKPTMVARQFGVSLPLVRKILDEKQN